MAGFGFDTNSTMDFSNMGLGFGAVFDEQQQSFGKSNEGNTSTDFSFFAADEGIDTSASQFNLADQSLFTMPSAESSFTMPQELAMDNTLGGTPVWDTQLNSTALNDFTFGSIYPPVNNMGKRSLQLDVQDFPQSKRHESYSAFSPFAPSPSASASMTTSSWTVDSQPTPASSSAVETGLSDEAADVCALWFSKYAILPSDRHINSLSQLTGEPSNAIRSWFGRLLKQGMAGHDSAYKSQTSFSQQQDPLLNNTTQNFTLPEVTSNQDTATTTSPPARGGKKGCTPTQDAELLRHDPNKIYQCTRKCGKRYTRKCDWKRNEEESYPSKSWLCSLCVSQGVNDKLKPCFRRYHFSQHFRNIHPGLNSADYEASSLVQSDTAFPRRCGFCPHRFVSRQDRIDHIADHFKKGKSMLDWVDHEDDNQGDDNTDDDDDDNRPDGGDSSNGNSPTSKRPGSGSQGGRGPKQSDNGSGGSGHGSFSGFGQFQLADSLGEGGPLQITGLEANQQSPGLSWSEYIDGDDRGQSAGAEISNSCTGPVYIEKSGVPEPAPDKSLPDRQQQQQQQSSCNQRQDQAWNFEAAGSDQVLLARNAISDLTSDPLQSMNSLHTCQSTKTVTVYGTETPTDLSQATSDTLYTGRRSRSGSPTADWREITSPAAVMFNKFQSFKSVKLLGTGGFSTVDEVIDRETSLRVSRKTLKNRESSAFEELKNEVNVLKKLRHPHIVRFLGAYQKDDKVSILLSPVAETTLSVWLKKSLIEQPVGLSDTIIKMLGCLSSSIRYLHEQRPVVIHMDIKPQNVLVTFSDGQPHVILSDFGISTSEEQSGGTAKPLTRQYCAPEVSSGLAREQAADIWSLGCVFVEMIAVAFSKEDKQWLDFLTEFSAREGKYYCQEVPRLHELLTGFAERSTFASNTDVLQTVKSMVNADPEERPTAAKLTMIFTPASCCLSWANDNAAYPGPNEELEQVEMLVREDGIDCLSQFQHVCPNGKHNHAHDAFADAKTWLDSCVHDHEACVWNNTGSKQLPTRLVDLQPELGLNGTLRVINSMDLENVDAVDYVAISYSWDEEDLQLSSINPDLLQSITSRQFLSKTLNQAISASERIGFRYLWVDSLCVQQDSDQDKLQECANMASIYRNATLTIVANSDINTLQGSALSESQMRQTLANNISRDRPALTLTTNLTPHLNWQDTRVWTLQERLLSRRLLHLAGEQMYWECNGLKASETFPNGLPSLVWEKAHTKLPSSPEPRLANPEAHLLRNCQWIKKEGDGIGDPMSSQLKLSLLSHPANQENICNLSTGLTPAGEHVGSNSGFRKDANSEQVPGLFSGQIDGNTRSSLLGYCRCSAANLCSETHLSQCSTIKDPNTPRTLGNTDESPNHPTISSPPTITFTLDLHPGLNARLDVENINGQLPQKEEKKACNVTTGFFGIDL
ncbi:hypothetical protein B0J11DRAFT_476292 [Dendryphion nanum]|uniref:Protein kinase domain-containing protein n=1 Tax=Dendryphion nanum TaxID=256645 RepID=A0A9P9IWT0_9PLEO|nr:hypothetical protein B0J11DRAFT_476292 [Dendryphion nanum]